LTRGRSVRANSRAGGALGAEGLGNRRASSTKMSLLVKRYGCSPVPIIECERRHTTPVSPGDCGGKCPSVARVPKYPQKVLQIRSALRLTSSWRGAVDWL